MHSWEWYIQVLQYHNGTKARSEVRDPTAVPRPTRWRSALYRWDDAESEPFGSPDTGNAERPSRAGAPAGGCFMGGSPATGAPAVQAALSGVPGDSGSNQRRERRVGSGSPV